MQSLPQRTRSGKKACLKIAEYFATEMNSHCLVNIWMTDGYKGVPADRLTPRLRLKKSLDEILSVKYDKKKVIVAVESKVFGIGVESYTVGSMICTPSLQKKDFLIILKAKYSVAYFF